MKITGISFENYKAFHKREDVEIRPLTILIGRNNSGKSAIARLPLLIEHALSERAMNPIDLEFDNLDFGLSFVDLIHNRNKHGSIGIGAKFLLNSSDHIEMFARIQNFDEYKLQQITDYELKSKYFEFHLSWNGKDPLSDSEDYQFQRDEFCFKSSKMSFKGLYLPVRFDDVKDGPFIGTSIRDIQPINYIGPFRKEPERMYRLPGKPMKDVGYRDTQTPELLWNDVFRQKGKILSAVNNWFSEHLGGWQIDLSQHGDMFSLELQHPKNNDVKINIADVGAGIAQVLPIIVQRQFEAIMGTTGGLEIVEQPELHLHPGAHGAIADLYIEAVNRSDMNFLIETHSENFVLRIRRRIAEGKLDSDKVVIYWIDDESELRVSPIRISPSGDVDYWPKNIFSEGFEEVKAIRKAQIRI